MKPASHTALVRLPFWLMIAAWICANIPASATVYSFVWMKGAGHFSHHDELCESVANLLSGRQAPPGHRLAEAETAARSLPHPLPVDGMIKKIDLTFSPAILEVVATRKKTEHANFVASHPKELISDVPLTPPRAHGRV